MPESVREFFASLTWETKLIGHITLEMLAIAFVGLLLGLALSVFLSRLVGRRLARGKQGERIASPVQKLVFWVLLGATVLSTLSSLDISISSFAFLGGALAIGAGFGAQNILNNFISGWILMAERPVRVGDYIEVSGHIGAIRSIGARSARIRRYDGIDILVPNSQLLENTIVNWTLTDDIVRTSVRVGVAYGSPVEEVRSILERAMAENSSVIGGQETLVIFDDFGDSALVFDAIFWVRARRNMVLRKVQSEMRFSIDAAFREAGIVIAFPQQDVHFDVATPIPVTVRREE